jgi:uncharacterized protein YndB with AHSA1/START domain
MANEKDSTACTKRFVLLEQETPQVWLALTEPGRMEEWLCDAAQVELAPQGRYDFSGKTVIMGGGGQRFVHLVRERRLEFRWNLDGHETKAVIRLEPQLDFTRLEVSHFHPPALSKYLLDDIWKYYLTLLKHYLEYGQTPGRIDFSQLPEKQIDLAIDLPQSPQEVWDAVTVSGQVADWLEVNANIDLRPGGVYETDYWPGCTISDLEPGRRVAFEHENGMRVEWIVESRQTGARLRLVNAGFADEEELRCCFYGWAAFLMAIAMYLHKKRPVKSWGAMI